MPKITPIKADINNIGEKRRTTGQRLETSVFNLLSEPPSRCIRRLGHVTAASRRRRLQIDAGRPLALPFDEGAFIPALIFDENRYPFFYNRTTRVEFFWSDPIDRARVCCGIIVIEIKTDLLVYWFTLYSLLNFNKCISSEIITTDFIIVVQYTVYTYIYIDEWEAQYLHHVRWVACSNQGSGWSILPW